MLRQDRQKRSHHRRAYGIYRPPSRALAAGVTRATRFAQQRALGVKVSDEFTVPLCRGHHRQLHQADNEIAWWQGLKIDALRNARQLWEQTHPNEEQTQVRVNPPEIAAPSERPQKSRSRPTDKTQREIPSRGLQKVNANQDETRSATG